MPAAYAESGKELSARNYIKHAETCFWFGVAEKGNMQSFRQGLAYLDQAEQLINQPSLPGQTSKELIDKLKLEIKVLRLDFKNQMEVHFDTFFGVFPLVRLLAPTLFADALATGTFELVDDPAVMASTSAGYRFCREIIANWSACPQLNVVFTSLPNNKALEHELLYVFNLSAKFFVHNFHEVTTALSSTQIKTFQSGIITPDIKQSLCKAFNVQELLIVTIREIDKIDQDYFCSIEGKVYNLKKDAPTHFFSNMGYSRDRNAWLMPIILINIFLLAISIIIFCLAAGLKDDKWPTLPEFVLIPVSGFILGRIMPWIVIPMMATIAPLPETLASLSFWWPCAVSCVLFLAPVIIYRIAATRIRSFVPVFNIEGRSDVVFAIIALGVCAYLTGPLFLYLQDKALSILVPLILSSGIALYILGQIFDDKYPLCLMTIPLIAVCGLGAAFSHLVPIYVWICFGTVSFLPLLAAAYNKKNKTDNSRRPLINPSSETPDNLQALKKLTEQPPYQKFKPFNEAYEKVKPVIDGKTSWLLLTGPAGAGKTATAAAIISELELDLSKLDLAKKDNKHVALLHGECPAQDAEIKTALTPYAPFQKALARHFQINLLARPEGQIHKIDSAFTGIFELTMPFVCMLFPPTDNISNPACNQKEIFISVAETINKLTRKNSVILFIDDMHWMDKASRDLLLFLLDRFPCGADIPLLILLTSRNAVIHASLKEHQIRIKEPDDKQMIKILVAGLGLSKDVAETIARQIGKGTNDGGGLFWLFKVVACLIEKGFLKKDDKGFIWTDKFEKADTLPIPYDYSAALEKDINKATEYRMLLECAACIGLEFRAEVLAKCLKISRMKLLQILQKIEDETGILFDVQDSDDLYRFRSSFMLEKLRKKMNISDRGPKSAKVPQLIREYHARVAKSLEKTLDSSSSSLFEVTKHYYASGQAFAEDALRYSLKSAHAARAGFLYEQARDFIDMATECAEVIGQDAKMEEELLQINCDEAHVLGIHRQETARECLLFYEKNPEAPVKLLILFARACYEAAPDSGNRDNMFARAEKIGHEIVQKAESATEKAEGYHFIGLSISTRQPEQRKQNLQKAFEMLSNMPENDLNAQALLARVANSLAEQLSYGSSDDKARAKTLFEQSIKIKERPELMDRHGLSMSHGGLGRLAYYDNREQKNIQLARKHFKIDLELSKDIGDITGQAKMHSFLGGCALSEEKTDEAVEHYRLSLDIAEGLLDKFFAITGMLECFCIQKDKEQIDKTGVSLLELIQKKEAQGINLSQIESVLDECRKLTDAPWLKKIDELAKNAVKK